MTALYRHGKPVICLRIENNDEMNISVILRLPMDMYSNSL